MQVVKMAALGFSRSPTTVPISPTTVPFSPGTSPQLESAMEKPQLESAKDDDNIHVTQDELVLFEGQLTGGCLQRKMKTGLEI